MPVCYRRDDEGIVPYIGKSIRYVVYYKFMNCPVNAFTRLRGSVLTGVIFIITYEDYINLGYSAVPEEQFVRYSDIAQKAAKKFLNGRFLPDRINEAEKRGLCEICDIYYAENQAGTRLAGFSNDNYREQYFENASVNKRVFEVIQLHFPREQLFRGI